MEITFQNKREDFEHFYNYMVKETEEGKRLSRQSLQTWLMWEILVSILFGALLTEQWWTGLGVAIFMFLVVGFIGLMIARFDPVYYSGMQLYRNREKFITNKDLQFFQLPRTITINKEWLEIRSSAVLHRWRWDLVDKIGLTPNFIFIHVGRCPVVYIPKRDFSSEQSFKEFGNKLVELSQGNKDQPVVSA